jgi:hypothetical protein
LNNFGKVSYWNVGQLGVLKSLKRNTTYEEASVISCKHYAKYKTVYFGSPKYVNMEEKVLLEEILNVQIFESRVKYWFVLVQ